MKYFSSIIFIFVLSCSAQREISFNYPKIEKQPITENHHGYTVQDDYRNIENLKDTIVRNWFIEQGALSNSIFDTLTEITHFNAEFKKIDGRTKAWAKKLKEDEAGNLYFLKRPIDEKEYKLFRKNSAGIITELYDPRDYKPEVEKRFEINYYQPSWNGKLIALSINTRGDFTSEIVILDLKSGKLLDYTIDNAAPDAFHGVHWLPDNSAFTYLYFPVADKSKEGYKANSVSVLHKVGDKDSRIPIFGNRDGVNIDPTFFPITKIHSSKDKYVVGYVANVDKFNKAFYTDIRSLQEGKPKWKKFFQIEDRVLYNDGKIKDNRYYYISPKFSSNYQVLSIDMDSLDFENPKVESQVAKDEVVNEFSVDSTGVYFTTMKNGVQASLYYCSNGNTDKVEMPFETGSIILVPNTIYGSGLNIETEGWAVDLMRYSVKGKAISEQVILAEIPEFPEFETIKVEEFEIKSFDGEMVPVSLIYDSKVPRNESKPVMIISYGSYGSSETPYFSPLRLSWISNGGAMAYAHIRGGGEKGNQWHQAGLKATKSNSWKDIIAVAEHLIYEGVTTKEKTILYSRSAGAISSGMAMIERPDLFKVFITQVPFINPSRSSAGSYKKSSYLEFGDIEDPNEVEFLLGMDPYLNLKPNVGYPATLIAPSAKDDRLDLWESGKFIARLQEYNTSKLPMLLDVNFRTGHSKTSGESIARLYGFAKWATEN